MKKILLLCLSPFFFAALHAQTRNFIDQPHMVVTGNADSLVTPDEIYIRINISEKDTKNKVSVDVLENRMADALKGLGIDVEKNLVINDITSNFKAYLLKSKDVLKSKKYLLRVHSAEMAGKVFIKLEDLGISNASIDHVALSDKEHIGRMMLSKATSEAHARAEALTRPLGQHVGKAIQIIADNAAAPVSRALQGRLSGIVVTGYNGKKAGREPAPDISFKKIRVSATVQVVFVLE